MFQVNLPGRLISRFIIEIKFLGLRLNRMAKVRLFQFRLFDAVVSTVLLMHYDVISCIHKFYFDRTLIGMFNSESKAGGD
jgi:hypothetical protein